MRIAIVPVAFLAVTRAGRVLLPQAPRPRRGCCEGYPLRFVGRVVLAGVVADALTRSDVATIIAAGGDPDAGVVPNGAAVGIAGELSLQELFPTTPILTKQASNPSQELFSMAPSLPPPAPWQAARTNSLFSAKRDSNKDPVYAGAKPRRPLRRVPRRRSQPVPVALVGECSIPVV